MINKKILYLGEDPEIISSGETFFTKKSVPALTFEFKSMRSLTENLSDCNLIIIDFTYPDLNPEKLFRQIDLLKHHDRYREIVIAGLFKDKSELENFSYFMHFGLTYTFIKGNDASLFFEDTFYITFDVNPGFPSFARARDLDLKYTALIPSFMTAINESLIQINSDIEVSDQMNLKHSLLGQETIHSLPVEESKMFQRTGDSLYNYTITIPYPGPWDKVASDAILKDTIETLMAEEEKFIPLKNHCLFYGIEDGLFSDLINSEEDFPLQLHFRSSIQEEIIHELLPDIIIIENNDQGELVKNAALVISSIKALKFYDPMLFLFNTGLPINELRDSLQFKRLLAHREKCDVRTLFKLLSIHAQKSGKDSGEWKAFNPVEKIAEANQEIELFISGISEHAISFVSSVDVPMYTNLKFNVPVNCYLLIVPTLRDLPASSRGTHYLGFIHGVDQEDANYLRKFVNQIIFTPLKKFERIEIKKSELPPKDTSPGEKPAEPIPDGIIKTETSQTLKRRAFRKSKL